MDCGRTPRKDYYPGQDGRFLCNRRTGGWHHPVLQNDCRGYCFSVFPSGNRSLFSYDYPFLSFHSGTNSDENLIFHTNTSPEEKKILPFAGSSSCLYGSKGSMRRKSGIMRVKNKRHN